MPEEQNIRIAGLTPESIVDGPGIRFTVFVQGCPHRCEGCQNPQTHPFEGGVEMTPEEIFQQILNSPLCQSVTISGGEPFAQAQALLPLARKIRESGRSLAIYSGYTWEQLLQMKEAAELLRLCDVLVDGPFLLSQRTLDKRFAGSRNQRLLDVAQSFETGKPVLAKDWQ